MSEQAHDRMNGLGDDVGPAEANGELVHWMDPKPIRVGPAGISAAAAGAFALGAATAVCVLAILNLLGPERRIALPRNWRRTFGA